jgi:membrane-bound lytic murein transglycosylase MltF
MFSHSAWLRKGRSDQRADIVVANLTITKGRLEIVDFIQPIAKDVREVLATVPSAPAIKIIEDLSGKELYVRGSSSYYEHMVTLNETFADRHLKAVALTAADENLEDEDLLEMVNAGLLPFAVVNDHKAKIWARVFKSIKGRNDIYINDHGAIAAATRKGSPLLKTKIDSFIQEMTAKYGFQNQLRKRYYTDEKMIRRAYPALLRLDR